MNSIHGDTFPISYAQQRMWLLDRMLPAQGIYNTGQAVRLVGVLDVAALERALAALVQRHESLRTRFALIDGLPVQVVAAAMPVRLAVETVSDAGEALRQAQGEARSGFDLAQGPPWRVRLMRLGAQEHWLSLTLHHIVTDGWSMGVLVREMSQLYAAFARGEASPLPALPVQYADYAVWQRQWLQGEVLSGQVEYWRKALADVAVLALPADHRRPAVSSYRGGRVGFTLGPALTQGLKALSRREGATLFMTLLAGFQVLLSRYSGQEDIAVGVPTAGRARPELEGLIGFFVNTLVLRGDLSGAPSFSEYLGRVRDQALEAFAHQDVPFEKLVEELAPKRDLARNPLFQVSMVLHNTPAAQWQLPGLAVEAVEGVHSESAKFDLSLVLREREGELHGSLEYARDLFEASSVERMVESLRVLLEAAVATPQCSIARLPLLTAARRAEALALGAGKPIDIPPACVHELIALQAARTPDAIAVVHGPRQLSYAQLQERASQLAHHLRGHGVGPDVLVGLCLARSLDLVVGMLGILQAGGAYVPLDPGYPSARLQFMLEDTEAPVLVTQRELLAALPAYAGHVVCLDRDAERIAAAPATMPANVATPAHLAYVIYTSGSTGKPKGVMIEHAALGNHMAWMQRRFPLTAQDRVLQKTPASADAAVWEFHAPLLAGATLVMAEPGAHRAPGEIVEAVRAHEITILQLVPAMFAAILDDPGFAGCTSLRRLFCGGEALKATLVRRFRAQSRSELVNLYGPTEATIDATCWVCSETDDEDSVPIGRPIDNVTAYVLDRAGELVPTGVPGELCLGGAAIARGYWRQPGETAARFVVDPFVAGGTARMYRTGDEARWRADGALEFAGRRDRQVKVRGVRIELEEIESALAGLPAISDAVVMLDAAHAGNPQLVAYVVPAAHALVTAAAIDQALRARLPASMLPSAIAIVESLPRLPNGKVDRDRLAAMPRDAVRDDAHTVAPRDPVEEQVAQVMCEVLDRESIGVHDDFFGSGGHSLSAAQVLARVGRLFGTALPMREFFRTPTVAALAAQVRREVGGDRPPPPAFQLVERGMDTSPVSYAQQRMWLLDRMLPAQGIYNTGQAVRLVGVLDVAALERALAALVQRHESLRTRFALIDGLPVQVVAAAMPVRLAVETVSDAGEALRQAQGEARSGFDLAQGPPWRVRLMRLGAQEHWLSLTLHHIVTDGWSMGVLVREMSQLYAAFARGEASPLPALPVQYADYAVWQRQWLQGEVLSGQVEYWRKALADVAVLALPADHRRPAVSSYRGGRVGFTLGPALTQGLKALSRREGATLFMTLLAGFQVLLSRYSGQEDIAVGVPTAGRARPELEGLIGFFVNTLVLRGDLSGAPSFSEYLGRVRDQALEAFAHQDVPFEKLVEELAPKRDLARNPLFQVSMVLHNTPAAQWQLPGLAVEAVEGVHSESAKFDLSLVLREREGELHGSLEYARDLFEASSVERMVESLRVLLEAAVATPQCSIARLPLLTAARRAEALALGAGKPIDIPPACVHELIALQAARTPDAIAVVHGPRQLSYAQLQERASQLAHHLRGHGVGPDVLVGLCLARSLDLVVGMLGILQAGGAYVPLDPGYPSARLQFMLEDTEAPVLVTQRELLAALPAYAGHVVCLDRDAERIAAAPATMPANVATPAHLAYVIYTSGSTGKPKGVMIEHRSVVALVHEPNYVSLDCDDVVGHASNIAFDAATFEIWGALVNGARIAVLGNDDVLSASAIARTIEQQRVTCMFVTTALFNEIVRADPTAFGALRHLLFGGEAHDPARVRELMRNAPPAHLVHVYGPTETTTFATYFEVLHDDLDAVPIGRPVTAANILLLDGEGEVVPVSVAGEIHIGGAGVARGYLNRPEETARRFVEHASEGVVFRSGDRARWNAQGALEYVGRNDAQVKIRGFRIEPAEISAVIGAHPLVRAAHVLARPQPSGYAELVAYFVPAAHAPQVTALALQRHVASRLPAYMVPGSWVEMEAFPRTANGKLDESAFAAPAQHERASVAAYAAPRDEIERTLCRIWAQALGIAEVGIDDDFFAIGGHSLLAARVFSRMDDELRCSLPLATLFECPTIRDLAPRCRQSVPARRAASLVAIARGNGAAPPIYMVSGVYGNVVGFADLARALGTTHPVYALQAPGLEGLDEVAESIEDIARRYLAEIRTIQPKGPYAFGGACFGATVAYEMARQTMEQGDVVACLALLDPTLRGGKDAERRATSLPRPVKRAATLGRFALGRLALYRDEVQKLRAPDRFAYIAGKLRIVALRMANPRALDVRREIIERAVYQGNLVALDRYRRLPLHGDLRLVVIIETVRGRDARTRSAADWSHSWSGEIAWHVLPGKDSGDMISGRNAPAVAALLSQHLRQAFAAEGERVTPQTAIPAT